MPLLVHVLGHDAPATRAKVAGRDGDAAWYDVVVIIVGLASLCGVGVLLIGGQARGAPQVVEALIGAGAVAVGWLCVHTVYVLRYARVYYASPTPPIDFNQDEDPTFSDFAYFSFNLGMAYQVSDTDLKSSDVRAQGGARARPARLPLRHDRHRGDDQPRRRARRRGLRG